MKDRKVSSQGFELNYSVPSSVDEYNALAPKRENPVLEDAIQNTLYRNVLNIFRDGLCAKLEEVTKVARINEGTEEKPVWESEGKYIKRVIATVAKERGLDAGAKATKDLLIGEWTPMAQEILTAITFDPSESERQGSGNLVPKNDIAMAKDAIAKGKGEMLATLLSSVLGREVIVEEKSLAVGLRDRRAKLAKEQEAADRAALGM